MVLDTFVGTSLSYHHEPLFLQKKKTAVYGDCGGRCQCTVYVLKRKGMHRVSVALGCKNRSVPGLLASIIGEDTGAGSEMLTDSAGSFFVHVSRQKSDGTSCLG